MKELRRHTDAAENPLALHSTAFLHNFSSVVTTTLAIIRRRCNRDHGLSGAPDVVRVLLPFCFPVPCLT